MFNKQVEVLEEENKIIITVSTESRRFITEKRITFKDNVKSLIPKEYIDKAKLISKPKNYIGNFKSKTYNTSGIWVYEIVQEPKPEPKKQTRTRRRKTVNKESNDTKQE